ncbi:hypothetical protein BSKO_05864 [Bryopsis sp. KO-2023]|nr:hypothetical protein BSKO_05864 [Bryopsis sp. KO-2023]
MQKGIETREGDQTENCYYGAMVNERTSQQVTRQSGQYTIALCCSGLLQYTKLGKSTLKPKVKTKPKICIEEYLTKTK